MKSELRQQALKKRKEIDLLQISKQICNNISALQEYKDAKNIGIFYPKEVEINLLPLCENSYKNFYLPKVINNGIEFFKFDNNTEMLRGKFNILEPNSDIMAQNLDIIIVPALMADTKGYRLGWGGGFYDRFLSEFTGVTLCPIPKCQLVQALPKEEHDKKCNYIVTEYDIIKIL